MSDGTPRLVELGVRKRHDDGPISELPRNKRLAHGAPPSFPGLSVGDPILSGFLIERITPLGFQVKGEIQGKKVRGIVYVNDEPLPKSFLKEELLQREATMNSTATNIGLTTRTTAQGKRKPQMTKRAQQAATEKEPKPVKINPYVKAVQIDLEGKKRTPLHPEFVWKSPVFTFASVPRRQITAPTFFTPRLAPQLRPL